MEKLQKIKKDFDAKIKANKKEIEDVQKELETFERIIEEKTQAVAVAQKEYNLEEYKTAKEQLQSANWSVELCKHKLTNLQETPLVSYDEYHETVKEINTAWQDDEDELLKQAIDLIEKLKVLSEKSQDNWLERGETLDRLQYEIGKDNQEFKRNKNGNILYLSNLRDIDINGVNVVTNFYDWAIRTPGYDKAKRRLGNE